MRLIAANQNDWSPNRKMAHVCAVTNVRNIQIDWVFRFMFDDGDKQACRS